MTKQCAACLQQLSLSSYNRDSQTYDKFRARCRECDKNRMPYLIKKVEQPAPLEIRAKRKNKSCKKYEKTKKGFVMRAYRNMLSRVTGIQKEKAHIYLGLPILAKEAFYEWALSDLNFNTLFDAWEKSKYKRTLSPSVDRIDSSLGYLAENIRWITHSQNSYLGSQSRYSHPTYISASKRSA